ncbi:hypothetical protein [Rhizorhabdus argentea]|uniref:hypothetical protein n=1 Tax=Rhizorhabdus argentea TaxID=1387174 RepID=UPI0030EDAC95
MKDRKPPATPGDGADRSNAPDSGEIEWAGGFVPTPPAPGEVRVSPDKASRPGDSAVPGRPDDAATKSGATVTPPEDAGGRR